MPGASRFSDREDRFLDIGTAVSIAELKLKVEQLEEDSEEQKKKIEALEEKNKRIDTMAARWKGGLGALIALGSIAGFIFTYFDKFKGLFAKFGG